MLIYDAAYRKIKQQHIVPLLHYNISFTSLNSLSIKNQLIAVHNVSIGSNGSYEFRFDNDDLLKALTGEIYRFYLRQLIQEQDSTCISSSSISSNWNIVTHYYNAFFRASLLLRLVHRGNIFLETNYKRHLENIITNCLGMPCSLDSSMFYQVNYNSEASEYVLTLIPDKSNTHELVWNRISDLIGDLYGSSQMKTDEQALLQVVSKMNSGLGCTYPSRLRNAVNYQSDYGIAYVKNQLYPVSVDMATWPYRLLRYDSSVSRDDMNALSYYMYAYSEYIGWFCKNLLYEYYDMRGRQNGILSEYNRKTGAGLVMEEPQFSFCL